MKNTAKRNNKSKIKIISFDLDGTLMDKNFDMALWYQEIPRLYAKKYRISFNEAKDRVVREYEKPENKTHNWTDVEFWFSYFGLKDCKKLMDDMRHMVKVYDDVIPALESLRKNHKLVVLTQSHRKFINIKFGVENIGKYFDFIFSTSDFKKLEKDEEIFREIMKKFRVKENEIMHVGDNNKFDYELPTKMGIRALFLDRDGSEESEHTIHSLREIEGKLL